MRPKQVNMDILKICRLFEWTAKLWFKNAYPNVYLRYGKKYGKQTEEWICSEFWVHLGKS